MFLIKSLVISATITVC